MVHQSGEEPGKFLRATPEGDVQGTQLTHFGGWIDQPVDMASLGFQAALDILRQDDPEPGKADGLQTIENRPQEGSLAKGQQSLGLAHPLPPAPPQDYRGPWVHDRLVMAGVQAFGCVLVGQEENSFVRGNGPTRQVPLKNLPEWYIFASA